MMRYLWVDEHAAPDYVKASKQQINGFFFDIRDATQQSLKSVADDKYAVGVYLAYNQGWPEFFGLTGTQVAEKVSDMVNDLKWGVSQSQPKVQFDFENKDAGFITSCFVRWRQLQPKRDTSWTLEGHQGGWIASVPGFVQAILASRVRVVPQCYDAPMTHSWDSLAMARDLTSIGIPDKRISPFLDAAKLDQAQWWSGFAFIQSRLP